MPLNTSIHQEHIGRGAGGGDMDKSTAVFLATVVAVFLILRWLIAPIPDQLEEAAAAQANAADGRRRTRNPAAPSEGRRPVTDSMVDVVLAIAPQLTPGQIRMDLERSGLVEATIDRFMEEGTLPMPPGEAAPPAQPALHAAPKLQPSGLINLIERYDLQSKIDQEIPVPASGDKPSLVATRREEMILRARRRLAAQLTNEMEVPLR